MISFHQLHLPLIPYPKDIHIQDKLYISINQYIKSNKTIVCKITDEDSLLFLFYTQSKQFMLYLKYSHLHLLESLLSTLSYSELNNIKYLYLVKGVRFIQPKLYEVLKKYNMLDKIINIGDCLLHQEIGITNEGIFFHSFSKL
jgi:hypothetical protein